jgi:nucleoside-diphosphate-sugar epimerase
VAVRILIAGATGVLGRAMLPHLAGHEVVGLTRSPERLAVLRRLGAAGVVCDAYDREALVRAAVEARPELVVNLLTDLTGRSWEANDRIRREGGPNVVAAARAAGARRLAVESVAFPLPGASGEAVAALERGALESGLEAVVLRFGVLWGPGTWHESPPPDTRSVHVEEAGRRVAALAVDAPAGVYEIV